MEKNKEAQRGAERLIDANKVISYCGALIKTEVLQGTDDWGYGQERVNQTDVIRDYIEEQPTVEAIPTAWIVAQIQDTCGAESSYYSRLLRKWREENGN